MYSGDWLLRFSGVFRDARRPSSWRVPANVWGLGVTSMLTDISSEMVVSILPAYLVITSGLAPLALGIATGLHDGGPMLAAWLGGLIADRSGRRKLTAAGGYGLSALCRLGWFLIPGSTFGAISTLVVSDRIGKAIRTAPRDAMISLSVDPKRLATAFGVHRAFDAAGAALGPLLAFVILWRLPRRYDVIFVASFVVAVLGVVALELLVNEYPDRRADAAPNRRLRWSDTFAVFRDAAVRPLLVVAAALSLVTIGDAFIYLLLIQHAHAGPEWIPLLYAATAVFFLALAVPAGFIADRLGRRSVFLLGHVLLVLSYGAALTGSGLWPWNGVACIALLGGYYASTDGVLAGLASGLLPADARAMGLAWVATAVSVARLSGAIAFGYLWTRAGDRTAVIVYAAALLLVLTAAVILSKDAREPGTS